MENTVSRLCADLEAGLPKLSKAVFSQPVDTLADSKVIIRPVMIKGEERYQIESFRDNKAFHRNMGAAGLLRVCADELDGRYRQALIVTQESSAQYILKARGGYKRRLQASVPAPGGGSKARAIFSQRAKIFRRSLISACFRRIFMLSVPSMTSTSR